MRAAVQRSLPLKTWGGRRRGAGRKRVAARPSVPHRARPALAARHPAHVTIRLRDGLPTLRARKTAAVVRGCLGDGVERFGARLVHYSLQSNHVHLLMEAADGRALSRAVKGLTIRIARALNRLARARGQVVPSRYHVRILKTPLEVRRALLYVLNNARKHMPRGWARASWIVDPFSSAAAFDGWSRPVPSTPQAVPLVAPARSWLLAAGWKRHGLIAPEEAPTSA